MSAMTEPTLDTFLGALRQSRLFDAPDLARLAARARAGSARAFADELVRAGDLTRYQADKLLRGRAAGLVLGPYAVLAPLGRGGMGTVVYLARDRRLAEELGDSVLVALKLLPARKALEKPVVLERFRREMELGRRARHPNVVRTCAAGESEGVHFLALEFVPGLTMRETVKRHGPMPLGDAAGACADLAAGLAHVHARGLVHRDVKPANVIVRPDGRAVLLDFGLALDPSEPLPADTAVAGGRGYIVGTMDYLAPEQGRDSAAVGPAADLYGLGCTLFYALAGDVPFPAADTRAKLHRHRHDPPPPVPNVPPAVERFVHALLAKRPDERPTAAEAEARLRGWAAAPHAHPAGHTVVELDAPGADAALWDAAPGDELPAAGAADGSALSLGPYELPDGSGSEPVEVPDDGPAAPRPGLWLAALASGTICAAALVLLVVVLRRL